MSVWRTQLINPGSTDLKMPLQLHVPLGIVVFRGTGTYVFRNLHCLSEDQSDPIQISYSNLSACKSVDLSVEDSCPEQMPALRTQFFT